MALPYMPLYVADYLGDTMHLTLEQHGAYLKLLMCMWRTGGKLPNDRLKIARMIGVTPTKWDRIGTEIMEFFEADDADFWSPRLCREILAADQISAEKSSSGESGARNKLRKTLKSGDALSPPPSTPPSEDLFGENQTPTPVNQLSVQQAAELIWTDAPQIARKRSSTSQVMKALQAAVHRRKNLAAIRQAVAAYYADPEKSKEDHRYAKGVHRVIQDDYWETWAQAEGVHQIGAAPDPEFQKRVWRTWMEDFTRNPMCQWDEQRRGPRPNEAGCRIPLEIMAEFNYSPPQRAAR